MNRIVHLARLAACVIVVWMVLPQTAEAKCTLDYYQKCWAAMAIGPDGEYGAMTHAWDKDEAVQGAFKACGGTCNDFYWFMNRCAALAYGGNGIWGFGHTVNSISKAESRALKDCGNKGGNCGIRFSVCSKP